MKSNKRVPTSKRKISALPFESEMNRDELGKNKIPKDLSNFLPISEFKAKECGGGGNCLFLAVHFLLGS